ncbi:hypothetical protein Dimus_024708 [Dionaea muscipula]
MGSSEVDRRPDLGSSSEALIPIEDYLLQLCSSPDDLTDDLALILEVSHPTVVVVGGNGMFLGSQTMDFGSPIPEGVGGYLVVDDGFMEEDVRGGGRVSGNEIPAAVSSEMDDVLGGEQGVVAVGEALSVDAGDVLLFASSPFLGKSTATEGEHCAIEVIDGEVLPNLTATVEGEVVADVHGAGGEDFIAAVLNTSFLVSSSSPSLFGAADVHADSGLVREEGLVSMVAREALRPQPSDGLRQPPLSSIEPLPDKMAAPSQSSPMQTPTSQASQGGLGRTTRFGCFPSALRFVATFRESGSEAPLGDVVVWCTSPATLVA